MPHHCGPCPLNTKAIAAGDSVPSRVAGGSAAAASPRSPATSPSRSAATTLARAGPAAWRWAREAAISSSSAPLAAAQSASRAAKLPRARRLRAEIGTIDRDIAAATGSAAAAGGGASPTTTCALAPP